MGRSAWRRVDPWPCRSDRSTSCQDCRSTICTGYLGIADRRARERVGASGARPFDLHRTVFGRCHRKCRRSSSAQVVYLFDLAICGAIPWVKVRICALRITRVVRTPSLLWPW